MMKCRNDTVLFFVKQKHQPLKSTRVRKSMRIPRKSGKTFLTRLEMVPEKDHNC